MKGRQHVGSPAGVLPLTSIVIGVVTLATYVWILAAEGDDSLADVVPFVALMGGSVGLAAANLVALGGRPALYLLPGLVLVCVGILGLFSIGLPLVVAGVLLLVNAVRGRWSR
jgi:hypothetical protein